MLETTIKLGSKSLCVKSSITKATHSFFKVCTSIFSIYIFPCFHL
nr:MAG TPA: hypothetical protein [Caudoviricetes sp.]